MSKARWKTISIAQPASYKIEVQGALDPSWGDMVGKLRFEHRCNQDGVTITTLTGRVPDQAALAGVLSLAYMLGMPLLSVLLLDNSAVPDTGMPSFE
jgi:hypothetical protein